LYRRRTVLALFSADAVAHSHLGTAEVADAFIVFEQQIGRIDAIFVGEAA